MDSKIAGLDSKISGLDSKISGVNSEVGGIHSKLSALQADFHRVGVLVEEQNARNAIVLDGYASLFERQERVEKKLDGEI